MKNYWIIFALSLACASPSFAQTAHGMVVSEHRLASAAGVEILNQGGNAIDAAVAVGYALAVVNPCCGNIGGGGFMTIHFANGTNTFLNFREKAPAKATKKMYLDEHDNIIPNKSIRGYAAVGVPGTVLGLETALKKYGTMPRKKVMQPAIQLAEKGYIISPHQADLMNDSASYFSRQPNVAAIFMHNGKTLPAGYRLIQTDLAHTLKLIANDGAHVFYKGSIARAIVRASNKHGGLLSLADFANYNVQELKPLQCEYRGYDIITAPPPSSGGVTLCETLNILSPFPLKSMGFHSAKEIHTLVEAMRYGYLDRNSKLGDPDFVDNPVNQLISKEYAKKYSDKIKTQQTPEAQKTNNLHEHFQTTHYSVMDKDGNAVSVTYTLNGHFGAQVIADKTGFFLNDEMDDFTSLAGKPNKFGLVQYDKNDIQPGKRPLSSMAPTIMMKNSKVFMVLGSPGGPRIITSVLQTIINIIEYGMDLQTAVNSPRVHFQANPNLIYIEPTALTQQTLHQLKTQWGYRFVKQDKWSSVEAIKIKSDGSLAGAADKRRPDGAAFKSS